MSDNARLISINNLLKGGNREQVVNSVGSCLKFLNIWAPSSIILLASFGPLSAQSDKKIWRTTSFWGNVSNYDVPWCFCLLFMQLNISFSLFLSNHFSERRCYQSIAHTTFFHGYISVGNSELKIKVYIKYQSSCDWFFGKDVVGVVFLKNVSPQNPFYRSISNNQVSFGDFWLGAFLSCLSSSISPLISVMLFPLQHSGVLSAFFSCLEWDSHELIFGGSLHQGSENVLWQHLEIPPSHMLSQVFFTAVVPPMYLIFHVRTACRHVGTQQIKISVLSRNWQVSVPLELCHILMLFL